MNVGILFIHQVVGERRYYVTVKPVSVDHGEQLTELSPLKHCLQATSAVMEVGARGIVQSLERGSASSTLLSPHPQNASPSAKHTRLPPASLWYIPAAAKASMKVEAQVLAKTCTSMRKSLWRRNSTPASRVTTRASHCTDVSVVQVPPHSKRNPEHRSTFCSEQSFFLGCTQHSLPTSISDGW